MHFRKLSTPEVLLWSRLQTASEVPCNSEGSSAGAMHLNSAPTGRARRGLRGRWWRGWCGRCRGLSRGGTPQSSPTGLPRLKPGFAGQPASLIHQPTFASLFRQVAVNGYGAILHTWGTPNIQCSAENCPYRAKVPEGGVTWHFMPGRWNWPYRP